MWTSRPFARECATPRMTAPTTTRARAIAGATDATVLGVAATVRARERERWRARAEAIARDG